MKSIIKNLILIYLVIVIIKSILSYFIPAPSSFSDAYAYAKMARSFFYDLEFKIHGVPIQQYPPLYSILLSISYVFRDMRIVFAVMKVINSIISSLIIFPTFYLSKEFLPKKKALLCSILVSVIPSSFSFAGYLMSENVFYPLFLITILFTYKTLTASDLKWPILTGVFLGLTYLTKISAIILIPTILIVSIINLIKKEPIFKKGFLLAISAILTILPWIIRNIIVFGFNFNGILSPRYANEVLIMDTSEKILPFISWVILYTGYLIIATGFIFFIMNYYLFQKQESKKIKTFFILSLLSIIFTIILATNHNLYPFNLGLNKLYPWLTMRPFGRYLDNILPLIFIIGFISLSYHKRKSKEFLIFGLTATLISAMSSPLIYYSLFPINNISLTWLGALNFILSHFFKENISLILILILLTLIPIIITIIGYRKEFNIKLISIILIIFFIINDLGIYTINYVDSKKYWYDGEQMQLGLWINDNIIKDNVKILVDKKNEEKILKTKQDALHEGGFFTIFGFWINQEIIIGDVEDYSNFDYIISKQELNLKKVKETKSKIYLYKTKG